MVEAELLTRGWHLSKDGIERCKDGVSAMSVDALTKRALDIDLKQIGSNALPADIGKGKCDKIQGPYVLQIQKVRNIGAPKANEDSSMAPSLLRLQLTDGHTTCLGVVMETIPQISLNTPPGTKVLLKGSVDMTNGLLMFSPSTLKVLGGRVDDMVERWELAKQLAHHTRTTLVGEGAPPPWVAFGQRHRVQSNADSKQKMDGPGKKRTLNLDKNREQTEQDREFEEQRKAAIKELDKAKGQGGKKFGGGGSKSGGQDNVSKENYGGTRSSYSDRRGPGTGGGGLTESNRNNQSYGNYREPSYEKKPDDKSISQLVSMGFSMEDAISALKKNSGNLDAAIETLVTSGSNPPTSSSDRITNPRSSSGPPQRGRDRPERGSGFKGRRGRRGEDDEDEDSTSQPSAPSTLFDFLESKLGPSKAEAYKPKEKESRDHGEKNERPSRYERDQSKTGRDGSGNNYNHNVRETPPRFQKLQAQKQAQRQMGDSQPGNKDSRDRGGRRGDRPDRYDDRRRDGKKSNEWTNDKEDGSQGYKNESRYKSDRGYQDRNERKYEGQSRGSKADEYQNDRGYQGRNNRSDRFQSDRSQQGRNSQSEGYQNDNGYQGRGSRRFDGQGKSGDTRRYNNNSKNDDTVVEKTYRLMERKKDNGVGGQDEPNSTKKSNGREATQQLERVGNWKGRGQEENTVKNQTNSRPDFQTLSQQSQPFIPQQQQQQMVSDGGRRVADGANQALNQQALVRTKVMTNGPEMLAQSQQPILPFKEGDHCLSKYWEDAKFYKAQITAIHPTGKTCMVKFIEYGNYEEVLITDIMPCPDQPWTAPPPSMATVHHQQQHQQQQQQHQQQQHQQQQQPPQQQQQQFMTPAPPYPQHYQQAQPVPQLVASGQAPLVPDYGNYDGTMNMTLEFRKGGDGPFISKQQGQDPGGYRTDRRNPRPAQAFYQPPPRR